MEEGEEDDDGASFLRDASKKIEEEFAKRVGEDNLSDATGGMVALVNYGEEQTYPSSAIANIAHQSRSPGILPEPHQFQADSWAYIQREPPLHTQANMSDHQGCPDDHSDATHIPIQPRPPERGKDVDETRILAMLAKPLSSRKDMKYNVQEKIPIPLYLIDATDSELLNCYKVYTSDRSVSRRDVQQISENSEDDRVQYNCNLCGKLREGHTCDFKLLPKKVVDMIRKEQVHSEDWTKFFNYRDDPNLLDPGSTKEIAESQLKWLARHHPQTLPTKILDILQTKEEAKTPTDIKASFGSSV